MLRELRIKNFTIIDSLTVQFREGLNILTGETGTGKSVVVDALGLMLGERASPGMIRSGEREMHIEASFDNTGHIALQSLGIDDGDGIILRRIISAQGKGRAYANDTPISLQTLSALGSSLVDIHGQHEHQGLLKRESHLSFLDAFSGLGDDVSALRALCGEASALRERVSAAREDLRERSQKRDFLEFQIGEIDAADLREGEKEALVEERAILVNLGRLRDAAESAYRSLYGAESSCLGQLSASIGRIREMASIDPAAAEILAITESALPLVEEASLGLRSLKDRYEEDPGRLDEIEERLSLLRRLEKKYGESNAAILAFRARAAEERDQLDHVDEQIGTWEEELRRVEDRQKALAGDVSRRRRERADALGEMVIRELRELGFQKADFQVHISTKDIIGETGLDDVEFLFSANPGEPPKPLIRVASGGELSRIMLAMKCIETADPRRTPAGEGVPGGKTLIFDEVDAGVGGVTAQHVGNRLKALSRGYQVLCITHLPQIAALADHHLKIDKAVDEQRVSVEISVVTGEDRKREIARMLSGRFTEGSLRHAGELLGDQE